MDAKKLRMKERAVILEKRNKKCAYADFENAAANSDHSARTLLYDRLIFHMRLIPCSMARAGYWGGPRVWDEEKWGCARPAGDVRF